MKTARNVGLVCCLLLLTQCEIAKFYDLFKAGAPIDLEDEVLVLAPFRTKYLHTQAMEKSFPKRLRTIVQGLILTENDEFMVRTDPELDRNVARSREGEIDWGKACTKAGGTLILHGVIREYSLRRKNEVNLRQGRLVMDYFVVNRQGNTILSRPNMKIYYPEPASQDELFTVGTADFLISEDEIRRHLIREAATLISLLFIKG